MIFTCRVTGATVEDLQIWQSADACQAFALHAQQQLLLNMQIEEQGQQVSVSVPVFLESSAIVSLRWLSQTQPFDLIVQTEDSDFFPMSGWWLDENNGLLLCPSNGQRPTIIFNVLVVLFEYEFVFV